MASRRALINRECSECPAANMESSPRQEKKTASGSMACGGTRNNFSVTLYDPRVLRHTVDITAKTRKIQPGHHRNVCSVQDAVLALDSRLIICIRCLRGRGRGSRARRRRADAATIVQAGNRGRSAGSERGPSLDGCEGVSLIQLLSLDEYWDDLASVETE